MLGLLTSASRRQLRLMTAWAIAFVAMAPNASGQAAKKKSAPAETPPAGTCRRIVDRRRSGGG